MVCSLTSVTRNWGDQLDGRCDLFSLGCVLYQMVTGKRAFQGNNTTSLLVATVNHDPPAPSLVQADCPLELSDLIMRLLAKDPSQRPSQALEVVDTIRKLEAGADASEPGRPTAKPPSRAASDGRRRLALVGRWQR